MQRRGPVVRALLDPTLHAILFLLAWGSGLLDGAAANLGSAFDSLTGCLLSLPQ